MAKKILLSQGRYVPTITTLHGTDITLVGQNPAFAPVVAFSIDKSDGVTAVSKSLRQQTYDSFEIENEIEVIYNFIDFDRFTKKDKDHFKKAIAPEGEKILIHISNFRKVKRVEDVLQVYKRVSERMPTKLLLVGDGPERRTMEVLCREEKLCDGIRFLGKQDAVEELLAVSDLFIMPSSSESFGLAALEAMSCEVPVISSNAGGIPEVNIHNETGFLSEVGDVDDMAKNAIRILEDEDMLKQFRVNALKQARSFDLAAILPQYEAYYEKIIRESVYKKNIETKKATTKT